jgi:ubiquinone/menaquinone biosynthesis C-methylase UbiE
MKSNDIAASRRNIEYSRQWNLLGEEDPLWAVVSVPEKRGGRWDMDAFLRTGVERVDEVLSRVKQLRSISRTERALDFGCGAGRLTQRLADYFTEVIGVDIAPSMVRMAERLNRKGSKCSFQVNPGTNLSRFSSEQFDFILADIVLQHIRPVDTLRLLQEFLRVTKKDGLIVFQLPAGPISPWLRWIPYPLLDSTFNFGRSLIRKVTRPSEPAWETHWIPVRRVRQAINGGGGTVLGVLNEPPIHGRLENHLYLAVPSADPTLQGLS